MKNFQKMKKNIVKRDIFMKMKYKKQYVKLENQQNVFIVRKKDILIDSVKIALGYNYKIYLIAGHQKIKLLINLFKNVKCHHLFQPRLWNGSLIMDLKM